MKSRTPLFTLTDLSLVLVAAIWGLNFTVVKNVTSGALQPIEFAALRFMLAALFLLPLLRSLTPAERAVPSGDWWKIAGLGFIGNTCYQVMFAISIVNTSPTNAALILATSPIFIALIGAIFRLEKLQGLAWLGILLSFAGIAIVILGNASTESSTIAPHPLPGDLLALGAALMWALYTLLAAPLLKRHAPLKLTALTVAIGMIPLFLLALPTFFTTDWANVGPSGWLGVLYSGALVIAVGYVLWNRGVQQVGPARTAVYANLNPVLAAIFAWLFRGDPLTVYHVIGAIVILTGITLTRLGRRPVKVLSDERPRLIVSEADQPLQPADLAKT
jgi:drug/metabolite transporter (DMT)-like permease